MTTSALASHANGSGNGACFTHTVRWAADENAAPASAQAPASANENRGSHHATGEAVTTLVLDAATRDQWGEVHAQLTSKHNAHMLLKDDAHTTMRMLEHAVQAGNARLLEELLKKNGLHEHVGDSYKLLSQLVVAIVREGDTEMLKALLQRARVDLQPREDRLDKSEFAPLILAAQQDNEPLITVLLEFGANPNAQFTDTVGWTALHIAAEWGNSSVVTRLLHGGADIEARSSDGETPLHVAARGSHLDAVVVLLCAGADVQARNEIGQMPLHIASIEGSTSVVAALLQHGALVDARDENGCTPLHLGAFFDENGARFARGVDDTQVAVVQLLLRSGADVDIRDNEGNTALENAQRDEYDVIVDLLVRHTQWQKSTQMRFA